MITPHAHILKEWLYQHRWSEPVTHHLALHIIRMSGDNNACNLDALAAINVLYGTGDLWMNGVFAQDCARDAQYKINPARLSRSGRGMSRCQQCGRNLWIEETIDQHCVSNPYASAEWIEYKDDGTGFNCVDMEIAGRAVATIEHDSEKCVFMATINEMKRQNREADKETLHDAKLWILRTLNSERKSEPLGDAPVTDENDEIIPLPYGKGVVQ